MEADKAFEEGDTMRYSCIIWDWNGTLADDLEASLRSVNDTLSRRNMPTITVEQYHSYIDTPIIRFYEHLFDLDEVPMSVLSEEYQLGYRKYFTGLQAGAEVLLKELKALGIPQVILTSSNRELIEKDTRDLGVREYFDDLLGADDFRAASKVQRGIDWIRAQSCPPENMVLIGDSLHDFEAAEAMGTKCILVTMGHQAEKELKTTGAPMVHSFEELRELLFEK